MSKPTEHTLMTDTFGPMKVRRKRQEHAVESPFRHVIQSLKKRRTVRSLYGEGAGVVDSPLLVWDGTAWVPGSVNG